MHALVVHLRKLAGRHSVVVDIALHGTNFSCYINGIAYMVAGLQAYADVTTSGKLPVTHRPLCRTETAILPFGFPSSLSQ